MKIGLLAMSGVRAHDAELLALGLTLPGFVERSKVIASLPSLGLLYLAGVSLGVRLDGTQWLEMTGLLLAGLAPFVVLGIAGGYLVETDALGPAIGGVVVLFALVGGVYGFQLATSGPMFEVMKAVPSYWLVQAGKTALGGGTWPAQGWIVIAAWTAALIPVAALAYRRAAVRA